jgi:hypothetical protein
MCILLYTYVYNALFYVHCVYVTNEQAQEVPLSGPQYEHIYYIMCCITAHKTPCMYTYFSERVVSNHSSTTEATRGCGRVSRISFSRLTSKSVLNILQIPSGCIQNMLRHRCTTLFTPPPNGPPSDGPDLHPNSTPHMSLQSN